MEILSLVLGWLLGLLSGPISERIKRHYQKNDVKSGITSEFNEIKVRLAMMVYHLTSQVGTIDRQLLEWEKKQLEGYKGDDQSIKNVLSGLNRLSDQADDKRLAITQLLTFDERPLSLKKFCLPFLESRIDSLAVFGEKFRILIFEIRSKIQLLNDEIDNAQFYFRKTFDSSISEKNYEIVCKNLKSCHENINNQAKLIVEKINDLISPKS